MFKEGGDPTRGSRLRALIEAARRQTSESSKASMTPAVGSWSGPMRGDEGSSGRTAFDLAGYRVLRELHRGGQGVVYEALQRSTGRRVAIKVMREGPFAGSLDRARFEREVRTLAQLSHPNIVAIHDSGRIAGHDYFVMDLIDGRSLDRYVSERFGVGKAPTRFVVELFAKICDGINAAHLRGVIHRDLKPGNVLVDREGEPHILDFGLAKQVESGLEPWSAMTMTGQFLGSLPWSSPEQAEGLAIDVRTDVYSLGVMLYECLTGRFPYATAGPVASILNSICESEPKGLSSVRAEVDGELETIVLKCLAKNPQRRYQSAGELGRDLIRYLRGEPIDAKRDSALYLLRKALWRYRMAGAASVVLLAVMVTFAAVSALQSARIKQERDRAEQQRLRADRAQKFLESMFAAAAPENTPASDVSVRVLLDDGARRVDEEFAAWPEEAAEIHETLGETYDGLGYFSEAQHHLVRALDLRRQVLGEAHPLVARSLGLLAKSVFNQQDLARAELLLREAIERHVQIGGPADEDALDLTGELASLLIQLDQLDEAEALSRGALELFQRKLGDNHPGAGKFLWLLGRCLDRRGEHKQALKLMEQCVHLARNHFGEGSAAYEGASMALAEIQENLGDVDAAQETLQEVIELRRKRLGDQHPALAWNLHCLARLLLECRNDPAAAEPLVRQALAIQQSRKGMNHLDTADDLTLLGRVLMAQDRYPEAEPILRESLRIRKLPTAGHDAEPQITRELLIECLEALGQNEEAKVLAAVHD